LTAGSVLRSTGETLPDLVLGTEWIVDAHGCDPASLRSCAALARLFARIVEELGLHPASEPVWHVFPGQGGITGLLLLTESHLACHTFPERGFAAFNLYCCRSSQEWPWAERLADALGASEVRVRSVPRGELGGGPSPGSTISLDSGPGFL
jgi:S-adenosylmethionine decarboxylase